MVGYCKWPYLSEYPTSCCPEAARIIKVIMVSDKFKLSELLFASQCIRFTHILCWIFKESTVGLINLFFELTILLRTILCTNSLLLKSHCPLLK